MKICFQINVYEKTYREMFDWRLDHYLKVVNYDFDEYILVVNNVSNREDVIERAKKFPKFSIYFAGDNDQEVLKHFDLFDLGKAYVYTIPHLYTIFYTTCDYIFHISEDIDNLVIDNFIEDSVEMMKNESIISTIPDWGYEQLDGHYYENGFDVTIGFSDQIYIINKKMFDKPEYYKFSHPFSNRYPDYGGECFEKRIDSYMMCNNLKRAVHKKSKYTHKR